MEAPRRKRTGPEVRLIHPASSLVIGALMLAGCSSAPPRAGSSPFMIRAFNGTIAKNGGKCLDYTSETVGSPIVLNDCSAAHAIVIEEIPSHTHGADQTPRNHEVVLRAGSRVIGLQVKSPRHPPVPTNTVENALVLQKLGNLAQVPPNQEFAIDGDSIMLAQDRTRVMKVTNGRGRNGTPIILDHRQVSESELWEFSSLDGTSDPTSGLKHVRCLDGHPLSCMAELRTALENADFDTVIKIDAPGIDFSGPSQPPLGSGVTVRGDRRGTRYGPLMHLDIQCADCKVFESVGNDTRVTGLRIQGPSRERNIDPIGTGIRTSDDTRMIIDRNDLSDWPSETINVTGPSAPTSCPATEAITAEDGTVSVKPVSPNPRDNVRILRNFMHDNQAWNSAGTGGGYGVNVGHGGNPTILGNTFLRNRHAIADGGDTISGYAAYANIVLSNVPTYFDYVQGSIPHGPQQDFDMHSRGEGSNDSYNDGWAGATMNISWNTFFGGNRLNFELRGTPCTTSSDPVYFRNNVTQRDMSSAIRLHNGPEFSVNWEGTIKVQGGKPSTVTNDVLLVIQNNTWGNDGYDKPKGELPRGDFDGDGLDDVFLATRVAFYYSPGGEAEWRLLASGRTDRSEDLRFGDFDGDGRTDVIGKNGRSIMVSWGGASEWEVLNTTDARISDIAVGDFDGDSVADLFYADGSTWFVSRRGSGPFTPVNTSSFRVQDLRFGDFNRNGKTDVFGVVQDSDGKDWWQFSDGAQTAWTKLRPALTLRIDDLHVADMDGDNRDDIVVRLHAGLFTFWMFSLAGISDLVPIAIMSEDLASAGHFRGATGADLLFWNDNDFYIAYFDYHSSGQWMTPLRKSRQDMR